MSANVGRERKTGNRPASKTVLAKYFPPRRRPLSSKNKIVRVITPKSTAKKEQTNGTIRAQRPTLVEEVFSRFITHTRILNRFPVVSFGFFLTQMRFFDVAYNSVIYTTGVRRIIIKPSLAFAYRVTRENRPARCYCRRVVSVNSQFKVDGTLFAVLAVNAKPRDARI